jgi:hypothetical protein
MLLNAASKYLEVMFVPRRALCVKPGHSALSYGSSFKNSLFTLLNLDWRNTND